MNASFFKHISPAVTARLSTLKINVPSTYGQKAMDELLKASVLKGGKRLRPLLTYLFAQYYGLDLKEVDVFARAIEMVHAASLAHDDVIDNATLRRGRDSINIQASNKKAVLAGDYLLASVIGELSRTGSMAHVQEMAKVIELLSQGEWLQADLVESRNYSDLAIEEVALKKTSSVMSWCALAPALICPEAEREKLYPLAQDFGKALGIAFQYLDDTFDFNEDSEKDSFLDLKNGQVNAVLFEWLSNEKAMWEAFQKGEDLSEKLPQDFFPQDAISKVKGIAQKKLEECDSLLDQMDEILKERVGERSLAKSRKTFSFIFKFLETRNY